MDYADGYVYGQHDALTWLSEPAHADDQPLAAIDLRVHMRAALVCLAHNLAVAGALCEAFNRGSEYRMRMMLALPESEDWRPGCGRSAP